MKRVIRESRDSLGAWDAGAARQGAPGGPRWHGEMAYQLLRVLLQRVQYDHALFYSVHVEVIHPARRRPHRESVDAVGSGHTTTRPLHPRSGRPVGSPEHASRSSPRLHQAHVSRPRCLGPAGAAGGCFWTQMRCFSTSWSRIMVKLEEASATDVPAQHVASSCEPTRRLWAATALAGAARRAQGWMHPSDTLARSWSEAVGARIGVHMCMRADTGGLGAAHPPSAPTPAPFLSPVLAACAAARGPATAASAARQWRASACQTSC